jgi:hypothetical protein
LIHVKEATVIRAGLTHRPHSGRYTFLHHLLTGSSGLALGKC